MSASPPDEDTMLGQEAFDVSMIFRKNAPKPMRKRELRQDDYGLCRCEAAWEVFYEPLSDIAAVKQVHHFDYHYDYSDMRQDSDGRWIVGGVKLWPSDDPMYCGSYQTQMYHHNMSRKGRQLESKNLAEKSADEVTFTDETAFTAGSAGTAGSTVEQHDQRRLGKYMFSEKVCFWARSNIQFGLTGYYKGKGKGQAQDICQVNVSPDGIPQCCFSGCQGTECNGIDQPKGWECSKCDCNCPYIPPVWKCPCELTAAPTASPVAQIILQTESPTALPTAAPTTGPTASPTASPTAVPTKTPTRRPTASPTASPTAVPTTAPTTRPTTSPTASPTEAPTARPTVSPTAVPTLNPTITPTVRPTSTPTVSPTSEPTTTPTAVPTTTPTVSPSENPTNAQCQVVVDVVCELLGQPCATFIPPGTRCEDPLTTLSLLYMGTQEANFQVQCFDDLNGLPIATEPSSVIPGEQVVISDVDNPLPSVIRCELYNPVDGALEQTEIIPTALLRLGDQFGVFDVASCNQKTCLESAEVTYRVTNIGFNSMFVTSFSRVLTGDSTIDLVPFLDVNPLYPGMSSSVQENVPLNVCTMDSFNVFLEGRAEPDDGPACMDNDEYTLKLTQMPTSSPTMVPTASPTVIPTHAPTSTPTIVPTSIPTGLPTSLPTRFPTNIPTESPTQRPTNAPTTQSPTFAPTQSPVSQIIFFSPSPTIQPTSYPTDVPTLGIITRTNAPTRVPTAMIIIPPEPTSHPTICKDYGKGKGYGCNGYKGKGYTYKGKGSPMSSMSYKGKGKGSGFKGKGSKGKGKGYDFKGKGSKGKGSKGKGSKGKGSKGKGSIPYGKGKGSSLRMMTYKGKGATSKGKGKGATVDMMSYKGKGYSSNGKGKIAQSKGKGKGKGGVQNKGKGKGA